MKIAFLLSAFLIMAIAGFSAPFSFKFNYQAVVRNGSGTLVSNGSALSFRLSILDGTASGPVVYSETQSVVVNNAQGLVDLEIGSGTPIIGTAIGSADFSTGTDKYLQVEVDITGGSSYTNMGVTKLQGVPFATYATYSKYAENGTQWIAAGSDISYSAGRVNIGTASPAGNGSLNVEKNTTTDNVLTVRQTATAVSGTTAAFSVSNASTTYGTAIEGMQNGTGWGISGTTSGSGIGVMGTSAGTSGFGVYGRGATGVSAKTLVTNGTSIELDGYMKVSGSSKTAFKTTALTASASTINVSYGGAASTDILLVTPNYNATVLPVAAVYWNSITSQWQIYSATAAGTFPVGCSFNVMVIKQ